MQKHILIVGKSFSGIKTYLTEHSYDFTVLQDAVTTKFPDKIFKNRIVCDFSSRETILDAVDKLNANKKIDAIITTYEDYILPASYISSHLGLPGLSESAARACTDKELMRQMFALAPTKISPDFQVIADEESLIKFASTHNFPLILKPANLSKSLLVTKGESLEKLLQNYHAALETIDSIYKKYAPNRTPKLIVEELLEGPIFSVDAFVDASGKPHVLENVVDYQTGYDIGYDDNFHYSRILPSRLSQDDVAAIRNVAAVGCHALGMTSSPAHVEVILTKAGPRIVEIGARNGGYRERMHSLANDIDITGAAISLSLNKLLDIEPKRNDSCAVLELFPKHPGKFIGIAHEEALRALPSIKYLSIKAESNQHVGKAGDGYKMCAVAILSNNDQDQFNDDLGYINDNVQVITSQ